MDKPTNAFAEAVMEIAKKRNMTLAAACDMLMAQVHERAEQIRRRNRICTTPDQYDPASDESHPDRGLKPE